jgi:hypothetical protein
MRKATARGKNNIKSFFFKKKGIARRKNNKLKGRKEKTITPTKKDMKTL